MDCTKAKELFVDYSDGVLANGERGALEKHLDGCASCKRDLTTYRQAMNEVSGLHYVSPESGFTSRVKKTIDRRSRGRFFGTEPSYSLKFAVISFVLILLFLLAYYYVFSGVVVKEIDLRETPDSQTVQSPGMESGDLSGETGNKK